MKQNYTRWTRFSSSLLGKFAERKTTRHCIDSSLATYWLVTFTQFCLNLKETTEGTANTFSRFRRFGFQMADNIELKIAVNRDFFILRFLVACTMIFSNSVLIYALRKRRKLKIITFKLMYILSIFDVFIGIGIIVGDVITTKASRKSFTMTENIILMIRFPLGVFTTLMILLIAVDRYLHMTRMHNYSLIMTHRRANILVLCCALLTILDASIVGISQRNFDVFVWLVTCQCTIGLACIIVVFALYYKGLRSLTNSINNGTVPVESRNTRNAGRQLSNTVFSILACLLLTITPSYILRTFLLHKASKHWSLVAVQASYVIYYLNSTFNAVMIICFSRDLMNCVRQLFTCRRP